ncbi:Cloroperoxidase [Lentithecium fluviatile CBS 122367]|uniref:Cloroperoxidase n=1 Tax=Lentithecium fluviatile CBS 122367 TaxID=1168545 RepID=A0A6G1ICR1_9PLEO|nr:Cloroperoxidase [Lentithecium fluviatile CBS 122367]
MRLILTSVILTFAVVSAKPQYEQREDASTSEWKPPGPDDFRGPCPMLNTLANHGFLPRDGRNITEHNAVYALSNALNFNATFAAQMWAAGVVVNPEPNATFFTLEQLSRHNVLEHDASLSRSDAFFGSNIAFNETIFNETRKFWTAPTVDMDMLANAKLARQVESRAFNPTYTFTQKAEGFSRGEVSSFVVMFGDMEAGTANRSLVEFFFENEKLPAELGWVKPAVTLENADIRKIDDMLVKALTLLTDSGTAPAASRRDPHFGV